MSQQSDSDYDDYESGYYDEQYSHWKKDQTKTFTAYQEWQDGSKTERYERENGSAKRVHCETQPVTNAFGVNILGAGAEAKVGNAAAGASVTPIQAEAFAKTSGAEAGAHAYLFEGITEANARVVVAEAQAKAGAGLKSLGVEAEASGTGAKADMNAALIKEVVEAKASAVVADTQAKSRVGLRDLGAYAGASATTAKFDAGVSNVPLAQVSVTGPKANVEGRASWNHFGVSAGAYAGEVKAGPFAVRAGGRVGVSVRNGVPRVDLGPVSTCSIL